MRGSYVCDSVNSCAGYDSLAYSLVYGRTNFHEFNTRLFASLDVSSN